MNHAVSSASFPIAGATTSTVRVKARRRSPATAWSRHEEAARNRRMRSLLGLFAVYGAALFLVSFLSDGEDIGCVLGGIAGHVLYATWRIVAVWRDAAWLEEAKHRVLARFRPRFSF